ncbi:hypothetical protein CTA1_6824 [Colletotrichum tanaceti]|uniref:Uncharacterized protein n=1 Tax=Colletotrichum tanaceti TaxID=1306861 RepID=A0A4U6XF61_9PEZI|nr:hypothetical protein CTA1_6824 [Colletotrichum tanaceti]
MSVIRHWPYTIVARAPYNALGSLILRLGSLPLPTDAHRHLHGLNRRCKTTEAEPTDRIHVHESRLDWHAVLPPGYVQRALFIFALTAARLLSRDP